MSPLFNLGAAMLCVAVLCVLRGLSYTSTAYGADKPTGVPGWEEFGPSDAERVKGVEAWKRANYAPDQYLGASVRSRKYWSMALWLTLIGGALVCFA